MVERERERGYVDKGFREKWREIMREIGVRLIRVLEIERERG